VFLYAVRAAAQARGVEEKEVLLELLREAEVDVDLASAVGDSTTDTR
jgi:phosphoserine phosphatase